MNLLASLITFLSVTACPLVRADNGIRIEHIVTYSQNGQTLLRFEINSAQPASIRGVSADVNGVNHFTPKEWEAEISKAPKGGAGSISITFGEVDEGERVEIPPLSARGVLLLLSLGPDFEGLARDRLGLQESGRYFVRIVIPVTVKGERVHARSEWHEG